MIKIENKDLLEKVTLLTLIINLQGYNLLLFSNYEKLSYNLRKKITYDVSFLYVA